MKNPSVREDLLHHLTKSPTIEMACTMAGIDRKTYYNWVKKNKEFAKKAEEAIQQGRMYISDVSESVIFSLISEKDLNAARFYLTHNNPRYSNKLELSGKVDVRDKELTKEQVKIIKKLEKISPLKINEKE
ncbi:MAG: hypothetical protein A3A96_01975 [Candidatus Zambryskibacteria bacterium RIFCSPLOWO2_01_FULL_39_39]|uniref:Homeodomain phBC6A51-type domain-containing protein n=1 Tax=Candidatus Zambryskibacteria bacterium RIFCSPLOWO2_01_FULL_39_39 TaxID=1802758 RepID=A0A1G2TXU5_9BACT|nr:MAG: hypothetical protein UT00_C0005G0040 [Parcubacteria group bacterium GW2011_GWA1_38_7]OHA86618.1 MAG: hypothetical protein A2644_02085 [Candidatus Zambryskibacteria bacterium RIFCSPHIGHO2_01_FULL_39_63]OHA94213.1 MAG: hypothetical protein A3B88_03630 [Candidatus Zambryskibacteria bacterium RIFCSPHIGHO2_02_FULL_39_19]OHA98521.1 MAG: hypothetical protein A3F20_03870 [Candidatus Zambryskibacteria bacterium RIFCSPHIGHO2_12_FULL_39_21]OHB01440.1 MAG: hypothetical protein A3A96_01975 [Candidat